MRAAGPAPGGGGGGSRARGVRRARASFVDESLFGSPAGARPAPPGFAPPWAAAPGGGSGGGGGGSRPRSKCRLRSHAPSFCDESLFGARPEGPAWAAPWLRQADVAKLHSLLWSPPPAPRHQPGLAPRARETPVRAAHPPAPSPAAAAGSEPGCGGQSRLGKRPQSGSGSRGRGAAGGRRAQSLSRLSTASAGLRPASGNPKAEKCKNQSPATAPATPRGPLMRSRSKSVSGPPSASSSSTAAGGCKPRPPWK